MFRLILFNTWTFVNVTSTRTGHNSAGLSEPVLQYILYRFWQFSWNDNMCKWKTWKVSSNTMGGHVVVAVWFPCKSPLHVLLLPVPVSLRSNKDVMVIRGRCWQEVLFTAVAFSYISPNRCHLIWDIRWGHGWLGSPHTGCHAGITFCGCVCGDDITDTLLGFCKPREP